MKFPKDYGNKGIGKTHKIKLSSKYGKFGNKTPYTDTDEIYNHEREKILESVLKILEKEIDIVNRSPYRLIVFGLEHAKLLVKDMKK